MAPRKKTEEKVSANEAADMVLRYLRKQNRPYSAIDVSANLHNRVTKAAAAKILKDLHEQKRIEARSAGKQIVYHAIQEPQDEATPAHLAALESQLSTLRAETSALVSSAKALRATLASLQASLGTADLVAQVQSMEREREEIRDRLENLRAGKAVMVSREEREEGERKWKVSKVAAKKREKIAKEVWAFIAEQVEREGWGALRERFDLDE